jgi:hypothetical protein
MSELLAEDRAVRSRVTHTASNRFLVQCNSDSLPVGVQYDRMSYTQCRTQIACHLHRCHRTMSKNTVSNSERKVRRSRWRSIVCVRCNWFARRSACRFFLCVGLVALSHAPALCGCPCTRATDLPLGDGSVAVPRTKLRPCFRRIVPSPAFLMRSSRETCFG